jgi:hypothetical protein
MTAAQAEAAKASATVDALNASLSSNEQGILLEVRRFAPSAYDIPAADAALRECAVRRKAQAAAATEAQRAQMRFDLLTQQTPEITPPSPEELNTPAPGISPQQLEAQLAALQAQLASQTSSADRLAGQISAAGDSGSCTGVFVPHGRFAALNIVAAHDTNDGRLHSERFPDDSNLSGVSQMKWIVFTDDSDSGHEKNLSWIKIPELPLVS